MTDVQDVQAVHASGEYLILTARAENVGAEIKSPSGIVTGYRQTGEVPIVAKVVSIGVDVPHDVLSVLRGAIVALPHAHIANVPHPDLVSGKVTAEEAKLIEEKFFSCHYKAIQVVYA